MMVEIKVGEPRMRIVLQSEMATQASDAITPSPAKRRKWPRPAIVARLKRGSKYKEASSPAESPNQSSAFPQPPADSQLLEVRRVLLHDLHMVCAIGCA